jgi:hypothetical protein
MDTDSTLDHFMWASDDLDHASRRFEALTGVAPRYGGMHADGLTHNAIVGLGHRAYLEILAPARPAKAGEGGWCELARKSHEPRILTYCLRSTRALTDIAVIAQRHGWDKASVGENGRTTPEGVRLRWQWIGPTVAKFGLAFPFFIDWLDSPHPAESAAAPVSPVRLKSFAVGHPDAPALERILSELGARVQVFSAPEVEFRACLSTPRGEVLL